MSIFNKQKNKPDSKTSAPVAPKVSTPIKVEKAVTKPAVVSDKKTSNAEVKGTILAAYRVLIKPLVTEKATYLGAMSKYIFAVDRSMNKIEVKKAIRAVYKVNPIAVNMSNFGGKQVRYGRILGKTKKWKKAIVTLKAGDKIEVYEGV